MWNTRRFLLIIITIIATLVFFSAILYNLFQFGNESDPLGLHDHEIDILAKIISVADSFDAMTRARPYRTIPLNAEEAVNELINNKGSQFNAEVVDCFIKMLEYNYLINVNI